MAPLWLRLQAPFGAFRWLQAGVYRATSPTIPPSTAWGLVLNLAGIESRDPVTATTTLRRKDVPRFQVALGEVREAQVNSLYQQLHGYPVGNSGKELATRAHGSKYWIVPVRRELLTDINIVIGVRGCNTDFTEKIASGLQGKAPRYGLPFLGDNNFLIDRIELLEQPCQARWFCRLEEGDSCGIKDTFRLTVDIDREDSAKTRTQLFHRGEQPVADPPESAWTWVPHAPI